MLSARSYLLLPGHWLLACLFLVSGCASTPLTDPLPLPFHETFLAVLVEKSQAEKKPSPHQLTLLRVPGPEERQDGNRRLYIVDETQFNSFSTYPDARLGDGFLLTYSILSDHKGHFQSDHYTVLNYFPRRGHALNHRGVGEITFGQFLSEVISDSTQVRYPYGSNEPCTFISLQSYPGMMFMVDNGQIVRADYQDLYLGTRNTPFASLWRGDMDFESWRVANPNVSVEEHEYQAGFYLTWPNKQENAAIIAEYVDGRIVLVRGGLLPHAGYVEGCS